MNEKEVTYAQNLVLMITLSSDNYEPLVAEFEKLWRVPSLSLHEWRDGVFLLSHDAILFDQAKAHDVLVQVCRSLLRQNRAYLLIPVSSMAGWIAGGKPSELSKAILERFSVPNPGFSPSS